jgi:hypothetical protein
MAFISSEISQEAKQNKRLVASGRQESDTSIRKLQTLSEELRITQGLLFEKQNSREKQRQVQNIRVGQSRRSQGRPSTSLH